MYNAKSCMSIFKKFQGCKRILDTANDCFQIHKFTNEGITLIVNEEQYRNFLKISQDTTKNDNLINSTIIIDFSKYVLIISYEAIIKNVYKDDLGYIMEFHQEIRGYSDFFYPVIVCKNYKAENIIFLNKRLGPYLDTNYYPEYLNNFVDLFHNLNYKNSSKSEPNIFDLMRDLNKMTNSRVPPKYLNDDIKLGKIVIVELDNDEEKIDESIIIREHKLEKIIDSSSEKIKVDLKRKGKKKFIKKKLDKLL